MAAPACRPVNGTVSNDCVSAQNYDRTEHKHYCSKRGQLTRPMRRTMPICSREVVGGVFNKDSTCNTGKGSNQVIVCSKFGKPLLHQQSHPQSNGPTFRVQQSVLQRSHDCIGKTHTKILNLSSKSNAMAILMRRDSAIVSWRQTSPGNFETLSF